MAFKTVVCCFITILPAIFVLTNGQPNRRTMTQFKNNQFLNVILSSIKNLKTELIEEKGDEEFSKIKNLIANDESCKEVYCVWVEEKNFKSTSSSIKTYENLFDSLCQPLLPSIKSCFNKIVEAFELSFDENKTMKVNGYEKVTALQSLITQVCYFRNYKYFESSLKDVNKCFNSRSYLIDNHFDCLITKNHSLYPNDSNVFINSNEYDEPKICRNFQQYISCVDEFMSEKCEEKFKNYFIKYLTAVYDIVDCHFHN